MPEVVLYGMRLLHCSKQNPGERCNLQSELIFFSPQHGPNAHRGRPGAPAELMCVAENILPKMILRLIQHLRDQR